MKSIITAIAVVASLSTLAQRGQNQQIELSMNEKTFQGQSTIFLKQEIKKQYPRVNVERWDLQRVVLVAKSAKGNGKAFLQVGSFDSRIEQIDGNRFDFQNRGGFHRIRFEAPRLDNGNWQIHLRGKIKVRKVILVAKRDQPQNRRVTRKCGYVLETVWGKDIKKFKTEVSGQRGSGVLANACQKARKKCLVFQGEIPLTQCKKL
jgi:hypothetical protein